MDANTNGPSIEAMIWELQRLRAENQAFQERLQTPASTTPTVQSTMLVETSRPRHRLPHLQEYSGKREEWGQ